MRGRVGGLLGSTVKHRESVVIRQGCVSRFCPGEMAGIKGKAITLFPAYK